MFKEYEKIVLSVLSDDNIERVANMPKKDGNIEKISELIYDINFNNIERIYNYNTLSAKRYLIIVYNTEDTDKQISFDSIMMQGLDYICILIPSNVLNKSESNANILCRTIIKMIYSFVFVDKTVNSTKLLEIDNLAMTYYQAIPVLACSIFRKFYSGASVSHIIYEELVSTITEYKDYKEQGIETILDIMDEGIKVEQLLDNSFICAFKDHDKYPGIW